MKHHISIVAGTCVGLGLWGGVALAGSDADSLRELMGDGGEAARVVQDMDRLAQGLGLGVEETEASHLGPFCGCFDTARPVSQEEINYLERRMYLAWLKESQGRYQTGTRWSGTGFGANGDPITLYWSFVPDGLSISGGAGEPTSNSTLFSVFDGKMARATWIAQFQAIFDRWHQLGGISYVRITVGGNDWDDGASWGSGYAAGLRGHVRISGHPIDGASGILAYTYFPQNGDMVFDTQDCTTGNFANSGNSYRFLRNTAAHEHGHGFGFNHVDSSDSKQLMEPYLDTTFDGPRQDDIRAIQKYYGDPNEPDNTPATAKLAGALALNTINLGTVPNPPTGTNDTFSSTLSIDANGEADYHKVTTSAILRANFTVTPVGSTYDNSPQGGSGNPINALAQADLAFDIVAADGTTVLVSAASQAIGVAESYTGVLLSPPGDFYLKVYESAAQTTVQLYKATITGTTLPTITASDGTSSAQVSVSWTAVPNASSYQVQRNTTNNQAGASVVGTGLATNSFNDTTAVPGQTYYYWAQATQGGGGYRTVAGPDTGYRSIPASPGSFSLSAPADNTVGLELTPQFTWTASAGASTYTLTLCHDANLSNPFSVISNIVGTSYTLPSGILSECDQFFWGVTAVNAGGSTASSPLSFTAFTVIPADFDQNGFVNGDDFDSFVALFEAGDPGADFDQNGFVNGDDFDSFVGHFEAGC